MSLFKQNKPNYSQWEVELGLHKRATKTAEETALSDNHDAWQSEIASSAYKEAPFLSEYSVNVLLDKVSPESNAAYGNLDIKNKFDAPHLNKDDKSVRVPIIVDNKHLKPLDLLNIEGKMFPFSESRLKEALFRPEIAELSDRTPSRDRYMGNQTSPPYGGGWGGFSYSGDGKFASILDKVSITESDKLAFYKAALENVTNSKVINNLALLDGLDKIASYEEPIEQTDVTCIQFDKLNKNQVLVKWASVNSYSPCKEVLSTFDAAKFAGEGESADQIFALEPGGSLTLTTNSVKKDTLDQDEIKAVTEFGEYNVQDVEDKDLMGWVLPLINFDGVAIPSYVFTNGSVWAYQDVISGSRVGQGSNLPSHIPQGTGLFYTVDAGRVLGTLPVDISHLEGNKVICQDHLGNQLTLEKLDIDTMVKLENNSYAIPNSMKFLRLPDDFTSLKQDGATFSKVASVKWSSITKHAEDSYAIRGFIAQEIPCEDLTEKEAEFVLATAGLDHEVVKTAKYKVAMHLPGGEKLCKPSTVKTASKEDSFVTKLKESFKIAEIFKLASTFSDEETVDKLLSLGVLNSDNIAKYSNYLPAFESVEQKLADLLFGVRCGLTPIKEENVKLAMGHMGRLIEGLRSLKEKQVSQGK